jgi:hypothetical protein
VSKRLLIEVLDIAGRAPSNSNMQPNYKTAIFRQINKDRAAAHHDALEFPDGEIVLLTCLCEDQRATVLQLPAEPKNSVEAEDRRRIAYVS